MRPLAVLAFAAALAAASLAARADSTDDLAEGEWEGKVTILSGASGGADDPAAPTSPGSGGAAGTPTPPDPAPGTTPQPGLPGDGSGDDDPAAGGAAPAPGPVPGPATDPFSPARTLATCAASWRVDEERCAPDLVTRQSTLTLVIVRNDAFAFLCNAYARSLSTWYVDWVASTSAEGDGMAEYRVRIHLEHECPECHPSIDAIGKSFLEARARVRADWGGTSGGSTAAADASTIWGGDLACNGACSASVVRSSPSTEAEFGTAGFKVKTSSGGGLVESECSGGTSDSHHYDRNRAEVHVANRASVRTYADDTENLAQAKARAGEEIKLDARSRCGAWAVYDLVLEQK